MTIQLISYDSYDHLIIALNGKQYTYFRVREHHYHKIKQLLKYKNHSFLLKYLKQFSNPAMFEVE